MIRRVPNIARPPSAPYWVKRPCKGRPAAVIDLDFDNNRAWIQGTTVKITDCFSVTRASPATTYYDNEDGTVTSFAANTLRIGNHGVLNEHTRTNVVLHSNDLTNAVWTKTSTTALMDQTGPDGVASSASKLTATAANGTCLQSITLASSARYQSSWLKRVTGTGTIEMTLDNGATWTAVAVTSTWTRLEIPTQTLANPTVGFRIVTSGDEIAVWCVQNENSNIGASSPIPTTTASVARSADVITAKANLIRVFSRFNQFTSCSTINSLPIPDPTAPATIFTLSGSGSALHFVRQTSTGWADIFRGPDGAGQTSLSLDNGTGFTGRRYHTIAYRAEHNKFRIESESGSPTSDTVAYAKNTFNSMVLGASGSTNTGGYVSRISFWDRFLTDADLDLLVADNIESFVLFEGDSIPISPSATTHMAAILRHEFVNSRTTQVVAVNVSGSSLENATDNVNISGTTRLTTLLRHFNRIKRARPNAKICTILMTGHNDFSLQADSEATFTTELENYLDTLASYGMKSADGKYTIAFIPATPSTTAGKNAWRATVNASAAAMVGTRLSAILDLTAFAGNTDGDASDTVYWSDGIHPTAAHARSFASAIKTQIVDTLLV